MNIIAIVGPSGSGKDTAARILSELTGMKVLCSYTTRPMREGEQNGREHWFVETCDVAKSEMLAYTEFGGYEYWTTIGQVDGSAIYVIDEKGLIELHEKFPDITLTNIYIDASRYVRRKRGVSLERIKRDEKREQLPKEYYDYWILNHQQVGVLRNNLKVIAGDINRYVLHNK